MELSFSIGKIAGIEVRVHVTLFIILPIFSYLLYYNPYPYGFQDVSPESLRIALSIAASISLFVAVLIHELSHSILSMKSGIKVKGIILFIFGGVSMLEEMPKEPNKEISIAAVGPLSSLALAALSYGVAYIGVIPTFFTVFGNFNLILAIFNLIPAFPLDGGRILRGLIAKRTSFLRATQIAAETGKAFAIAMGVLGLFTSPWLILIALFIYMGASEEEKVALIENVLKKIKIADIMTPNPICVTPDMKASEVLEMMLKYKHLGYPVVEDGKLVGIVTLNDVAKAKDALVRDVMTREVVTIGPFDSAFKAFRLINEYRVGRLPVVEDGKLVGIVSRTDLVRTLEIVGAIGSE
ncbi:CBS domain-containing protein [Archaeoglobus veneficus]|uniref:Zinc metalloprotease n=1 Tax=Archaeoglobus veneficus (strain DSM 11195 / SNP6) TaxID=693661 RepID=F2KQQ3_ARCVS|nr:CBS domain-containing protein [Archaeoglobus veneficus]AEA46615.1 CBS domain containing protein [Archaeoglobus veneficus SNP6]